MAGEKTSANKLNKTLIEVSRILNEHDINQWFVIFGTLLGIVREGSCIEGDDDLDIMIHYNYHELRAIFESNGFQFEPMIKSHNILKTLPSDEYASFDFYMCEMPNNNTYYSPWQNVEANNVSIVKREFFDFYINMPNDSELRVERLYGKNWKTPINYTTEQHHLLINGDSIYNTSFKSII
jgi:hypothetical protein